MVRSIPAQMSDEARRERFRRYFEGPPLRGDRAKLMERAKITKGRVTQLLKNTEAFGERAAMTMAVRLGLPEDYFLRDPDEAEAAATGRRYSTQALDLAQAFDARCDESALTGEQRRRLYARVLAAIRDEDGPNPSSARRASTPDGSTTAAPGADRETPHDTAHAGRGGQRRK
jgi:hypothetical protein